MADRLHLIRMQNARTPVILDSLPASDYSQKRRKGGAAINIEKERVMGYRSTRAWSERDPRYRLANSKQRQVLWGREAPRALTWWSFFERQGRRRANSAQDSESEVIDTTCETSSSKIVERRCQMGAAVWFEQVNKWVEGFRGRAWELNAQRTAAGMQQNRNAQQDTKMYVLQIH